MLRAARLLPLLFGVSLAAQRGDRADEVQVPLPADLAVPPAPAHTPAAEQATFRLAPGFRVELFAAEPMVADPVAANFDLAGRLWVVEMRGYMNDLDATDERAPNGRVVVLTDRDGDGTADGSTTFLDGLVLPRSVLPLRGGALVVAPPELWWCPDADGDLVADGKVAVAGGFEAGLDNPEHSGNGLLWGFDHRIHLANDQRVFRPTATGFVAEPGAGGGQWGLSQDDRGRLWFNYNEDWLRCDLVPGRNGPRAANLGGLPLLNHRVVPTRTVWPIRITPGVNRGYQPGRLVDWVLAIHTAVCAPHVYRADLLPCDGDVFVCEPAGNLVRRFVLREHDGVLRADNPYEAEKREFLASTDERFRPVSLLTGFDGALWVVDMYRGVIQHRNFVTTFLKKQIEQRGLERPIGLGRIWRVVPDALRPPNAGPRSLADVAAVDLVQVLAHPNGTLRDLALRDLVQRRATAVAPGLRALFAGSARPAVRIATLSALAGLDALTTTEVRAALRDADPGVVAFALGLAAPLLATGDRHLWLAADRLAAHPAPVVRWQLALLLGDVLALPGGGRHAAQAGQLWSQLVGADAGDGRLRAAVATAAPPSILADLLAGLATTLAGKPKAEEAWRDLAARLLRSRQATVQQRLFEQAGATADGALRTALLRGACDVLPKGNGRVGWYELPAVPPALVALLAGSDPVVAALAQELVGAIAITGTTAPATVADLTPEERSLATAGETTFRRACAACHQLDGNGMQGLAPPLRDSEWVTGPAERLVRIALHGVKGPIEVNGATWSLEMPGQRHLGDQDLAGVLTWLRRAFGHRQGAVSIGAVAAERRAHAQRSEPWTATELLGGK